MMQAQKRAFSIHARRKHSDGSKTKDEAAHKLIQSAITIVYNSNEAGDDLGKALLRAFRDKITGNDRLGKRG